METRQTGFSVPSAKGMQSLTSRQMARERVGVDLIERPGLCQQILEMRDAVGDRRPKAFDAQQRRRVGAERTRGDAAGNAVWQMRRARHLGARSHGERHRVDRVLVGEAANGQRRLGLGGGQTLKVRSVTTASVPHEPAINFDMSYPVTFLTTRPPDLNASPLPETALMPRTWSRAAPAFSRRGPDELAASTPPMVPRLAGLARLPEQRAIIHRLEGQLLAALGQHCLDLGERRAGSCRQHQLLGLVQRDAGELRQVERMRGLQRPADAALGAVADDLQRRVLRHRPLHGGEHIGRGGGGEGGHERTHPESGDGSLDVAPLVLPDISPAGGEIGASSRRLRRHPAAARPISPSRGMRRTTARSVG